ncbi:hypothetical protein IM774_00755 [Erysipelotrichaceae bacterium RD49]|nr:hypothetical protein [Erysipelotrichaceae bacterium RD49]
MENDKAGQYALSFCLGWPFETADTDPSGKTDQMDKLNDYPYLILFCCHDGLF